MSSEGKLLNIFAQKGHTILQRNKNNHSKILFGNEAPTNSYGLGRGMHPEGGQGRVKTLNPRGRP